MSYAEKLIAIVLLCHAAGLSGMQLCAQELRVRNLAIRRFSEPRDVGILAQIGQPSPEGFGTAKFREAHRFWDRENVWLFAGVGAARALDYTSTLNMRRRGRQEILLDNAVVDNHPLFAGIEAIGTGASIGLSYWLHRTDHHRLERWVSIVHIGLASSGAARNYALRTFHTVPAR